MSSDGFRHIDHWKRFSHGQYLYGYWIIYERIDDPLNNKRWLAELYDKNYDIIQSCERRSRMGAAAWLDKRVKELQEVDIGAISYLHLALSARQDWK